MKNGESGSNSAGILGSLVYAAPELEKANHTSKVDVYSFAVVYRAIDSVLNVVRLWQLYLKKTPWIDLCPIYEIASRVANGERPQGYDTTTISELCQFQLGFHASPS